MISYGTAFGRRPIQSVTVYLTPGETLAWVPSPPCDPESEWATRSGKGVPGVQTLHIPCFLEADPGAYLKISGTLWDIHYLEVIRWSSLAEKTVQQWDERYQFDRMEWTHRGVLLHQHTHTHTLPLVLSQTLSNFPPVVSALNWKQIAPTVAELFG